MNALRHILYIKHGLNCGINMGINVLPTAVRYEHRYVKSVCFLLSIGLLTRKCSSIYVSLLCS